MRNTFILSLLLLLGCRQTTQTTSSNETTTLPAQSEQEKSDPANTYIYLELDKEISDRGLSIFVSTALPEHKCWIDFNNNKKKDQGEAIETGEWITLEGQAGFSLYGYVTTLYVAGNTLRAIDFSHNKHIENIDVNTNRLTTLDLSGLTHLKHLCCYNNKIKQLDLSDCKSLETLHAGSNLLSGTVALPSTNNLQKIALPNNQIKHLDLSNCKKLEYLWVSDNPLEELEVKNCEKLLWLWSDRTALKRIDLSHCKRLKELSCASNHLTELDLSHNVFLTDIDCSDNAITQLNVNKDAELAVLWIGNTKIKKIDLSDNPQLQIVYWNGTPLEEVILRNGVSEKVVFQGSKTKIVHIGEKVDRGNENWVVGTSKLCNFEDLVREMAADMDSEGKPYTAKLKPEETDFSPLLFIDPENYLGYIGTQMKYLKVAFTSVKRDKKDAKVYHVEGWTRTGGNKRLFRGEIRLKELRAYPIGRDEEEEQQLKIKEKGMFIADFEFDEYERLPATGVFKGEMTLRWLLPEKGKLMLYPVAGEYYIDNAYIGKWTSKSNQKTQPVVWAQNDELPCSGDLNMSASDFMPNYKYYPYGWKEARQELMSVLFKN